MSQHYLQEELEPEVITDSSDSDAPVKESRQERDREKEGLFAIFDLPLFQWKAFFLFSGCCLGIIFHWLFTSDIFDTPPDVAHSRTEFFLALDRYQKNQPYWDAKYSHFMNAVRDELAKNDDKACLTQFKDASIEVLISFLIKEFDANIERLDRLCIYPKENLSSLHLILSKYEQGIWPLKILLSLELEIKVQDAHFTIDVTRLRRGSRDISSGLSWAYFGTEIEPLKRLDLFSLPHVLHGQ